MLQTKPKWLVCCAVCVAALLVGCGPQTDSASPTGRTVAKAAADQGTRQTVDAWKERIAGFSFDLVSDEDEYWGRSVRLQHNVTAHENAKLVADILSIDGATVDLIGFSGYLPPTPDALSLGKSLVGFLCETIEPGTGEGIYTAMANGVDKKDGRLWRSEGETLVGSGWLVRTVLYSEYHKGEFPPLLFMVHLFPPGNGNSEKAFALSTETEIHYGSEKAPQFPVFNVSKHSSAGGSEVIGEIINETLFDYSLVVFELILRDEENQLLDVEDFNISSFKSGQTRAFKVWMERPLPKNWTWQIDVESSYTE